MAKNKSNTTQSKTATKAATATEAVAGSNGFARLGALRPGFDPVAVLSGVRAHLDPEFVRTSILERVDERQKAALATIKRGRATLDRYVPAVEIPGVPAVRNAVRANVDFAVKLTKKQADFVGKAVKAVVPAS